MNNYSVFTVCNLAYMPKALVLAESLIKYHQEKLKLAMVLYMSDHSTYQRIKTAIAEGYKLYIFDNFPDDKSKLLIEEHKKILDILLLIKMWELDRR